jgi:hypothetical protein
VGQQHSININIVKTKTILFWRKFFFKNKYYSDFNKIISRFIRETMFDQLTSLEVQKQTWPSLTLG